MVKRTMLKRLLLEGKIVGYEYTCPDDDEGGWYDIYHLKKFEDLEGTTPYTKGLCSMSSDLIDLIIDYDDYELGMWSGEHSEWWFEGDTILTDEAGWSGTLVFDNEKFLIEDGMGGFSANCNWKACKRIGEGRGE